MIWVSMRNRSRLERGTRMVRRGWLMVMWCAPPFQLVTSRVLISDVFEEEAGEYVCKEFLCAFT